MGGGVCSIGVAAGPGFAIVPCQGVGNVGLLGWAGLVCAWFVEWFVWVLTQRLAQAGHHMCHTLADIQVPRSLAQDARMPATAYVRFPDHGGASSLTYLKAVVQDAAARPSGPKVFFQVREAVVALHLHMPDYWHRWYKRIGKPKAYVAFLASLAAEEVDWRPSAKQGRSLKFTDEQMGQLSPEVVCSATLLVGHLADWASRLKRPASSHAGNVLRDILATVLPARFKTIPKEVWALPARSAGICTSVRNGQQHASCCHCLGVLEASGWAEDSIIVPGTLADIILELYPKRLRCPLLGFWAYSVLQKAGDLLEKCFAPGHRWAASSEGIPATRGRTKRMRLDRDLMINQIKKLVALKRVRAAAHAQRAGIVDCAPESARAHEENAMKLYLSSTMKEFSGCRQITMATDESVVGGEGTMLGAMWSHKEERLLAGPSGIRLHTTKMDPLCSACAPAHPLQEAQESARKCKKVQESARKRKKAQKRGLHRVDVLGRVFLHSLVLACPRS